MLTAEQLYQIREALETGLTNTTTLWWQSDSSQYSKRLDEEREEIQQAIALIDQALAAAEANQK